MPSAALSTRGGALRGPPQVAFQTSFNLSVTASAAATVACIPSWLTDFRADLPKIEVPILVIDGDAERVLPYDKTGALAAIVAAAVPVRGCG